MKANKTAKTRFSKQSLIDEDVVNAAITELIDRPSRQEAQALLESRFPSKTALETIARHLDIPIVRQDKVEDLRRKIVEATVGARLRSQAIRGYSR